MLVKFDSDLKKELQDEFSLTDEQVQQVIDKLDGIVEFETWDMDDVGPISDKIRYTTFDKTTGLPIVHSRKLSNYAVNLGRIYKSSELHETIFDLVEDATSVPRMLYRIARFGITESKITLGKIASAIYYLFWVDAITPVATSDGFSKISERLTHEFGSEIDEARYQSCLDELVADGLIEIDADIVRIIERPWPSTK